MIAHFDTSALVKLHVDERGSHETMEFAARAEVVATSLVSRTEVAAALAKAVRARLLPTCASMSGSRQHRGPARC